MKTDTPALLPASLAESSAAALADLEREHLLRGPRKFVGPQGVELRESAGGAEFTGINFSSNDYLGLANHPRLVEAAREALGEFGLGAGASRLVCGSLAPHRELEERLAEFKGTAGALSFSSGYATSVGVIPALVGAEDVVIMDKLCHASLIDGARLSGAAIRVFPHNNMEKLASHLAWANRTHPAARVLVLAESVYSMDGDLAPLAELVTLKNQFGAWLMLDEAHALGILGRGGRGLADALGLADQVDVQMGTLSKALGGSGGYVCGDRATMDLLVNRARSFVFSTAPPPALAAAASAGIALLDSVEGDTLRERLWRNIRQLHAAIPAQGSNATPPQSAIIPWIIGEESLAIEKAEALYQNGFLVPAIRYPTVARGQARLRFTATAGHTEVHLRKLSEALGAV